MKRRFFLQIAAALVSCAPWLRNQSTVFSPALPEREPESISRSLVRVTLPGGWTYESMTMDGPDIAHDWFGSGGSPVDNVGYPGGSVTRRW